MRRRARPGRAALTLSLAAILVAVLATSLWQLLPNLRSPGTGVGGGATARGTVLAAAPAPASLTPESLDGYARSVMDERRGDYRGVYLSGPGAATPAIYDTTIRLIERTELNAVVIDVKEDGHVYFDAQDPFVRSAGAVHPILKDIREKLADLKARHIYTIARIVVFKDPGLAQAHPEWAVQDARGGVWHDSGGQAWMDAYNTETWRYNIAIAKEAAGLGFDEIQFDYVRFPSDGKTSLAQYPDANGRTRVEVVSGFLQAARAALEPLGVAVSADIFGLIPTARDDQFIGQHWEEVTASLDYASPMAYPSHYAPYTFGLPSPMKAPGETVANTVQDALART
ncbi:MAG: hypothetical protein IRY92_11905, partial [Dactylosporangium sp.]|nr:hypothetical protein [Dactylosporangium sp.]